MTDNLYIIEKNGLYYRPDSCGYTGLKSEAGLYTLEEVSMHFPNMDSENQDGMSFIGQEDTPYFSSACPWDVKMKQEAYNAGYADALKSIIDDASEDHEILDDWIGDVAPMAQDMDGEMVPDIDGEWVLYDDVADSILRRLQVIKNA